MWRAEAVIFLANSASQQVLQVMTFVRRHDNADKLDNITLRGGVWLCEVSGRIKSIELESGLVVTRLCGQGLGMGIMKWRDE